MRSTIAACAVVAIAGAGLTAVEITNAVGEGAVDERVIHEPVHTVAIDAEDGDVALYRAAEGVHVRVERDHLVNTPSTTQEVARGVLTLKTRCPIGFVACRSDYRVGVPEGVAVTVRKPSGRVDARAVGGKLTHFREAAAPLTVATR
jgi:hypothetical protein